MAADVRDVIKNCELFWNLTSAQVDKLTSIAKEETFSAGQRIFSEGELLPKFYIVSQGKASLEMEIWIGMLVTFALGFGLAIFFELYYWGKYALTIRKQDQVIEELKKKVAALEAPATPEVQPPTVQDQS